MSVAGWFQLAFFVAIVAVTAAPLGRYMAAVYGDPDHEGTPTPAPGERVFGPIDRILYRLFGVDPAREQRWSTYAVSLLAFSIVSVLSVYVLQRVQGSLPLNPTDTAGVEPSSAFNTAVSFMTNTNWQGYGGEYPNGMAHVTQMLGLAVQNFVSAAAGMAVVVAIIRGITRRRKRTLGNFWVDLTRSTTRILLPLSLGLALVLVGRGVVQNVNGFTEAVGLEGATQLIPGGPAASQIAIKQLGTNGGGFFNVNSAHPFENPDAWTNLISNWAIVVVSFAFCVTFGLMVKDRRQGRILLVVMGVLWAVSVLFATFAETNGNPELTARGADQSVSAVQSGGNMEGKELRFGADGCGLWAGSTTGTSNGSVNCMHDSMTPLGGAVPLASMMLGEVSPGGVGVGLMGLLVYAILAVFIAGLMVGRTPEYLGKKIQAPEMKLITLFILAMPVAMLSFAGVSVLLDTVTEVSIQDPGAHGLSEVLYAFTSASNNNGSAFAGLTANTQWMNTALGICMLIGRFFLIIPALAVGGSLVRKQHVPETAGTFPTTSPLFAGLLGGVVLIVAGLTFFPALALGPIVEHLSL